MIQGQCIWQHVRNYRCYVHCFDWVFLLHTQPFLVCRVYNLYIFFSEKQLGSVCNKSAECFDTNALCTGNTGTQLTCQCPSGYYIDYTASTTGQCLASMSDIYNPWLYILFYYITINILHEINTENATKGIRHFISVISYGGKFQMRI